MAEQGGAKWVWLAIGAVAGFVGANVLRGSEPAHEAPPVQVKQAEPAPAPPPARAPIVEPVCLRTDDQVFVHVEITKEDQTAEGSRGTLWHFTCSRKGTRECTAIYLRLNAVESKQGRIDGFNLGLKSYARLASDTAGHAVIAIDDLETFAVDFVRGRVDYTSEQGALTGRGVGSCEATGGK